MKTYPSCGAAEDRQQEPPAGTRREQQEWWAAVDDQVKRVTGYSCGTQDKYWWCPKAGYSLMEGVHLFTTEAEALDKAVEAAEREVVKRTEIVEKLKARRSIVPVSDAANNQKTL